MEQKILFSDDEDEIIEEKNDLDEEEEDDYWDEETRAKFMKASCEIKEDIYKVFEIKKKKKKKERKIKETNRVYLQFDDKINIDDYKKDNKKKWKSKTLESKNQKKKEYKFNPKLPPWDFR